LGYLANLLEELDQIVLRVAGVSYARRSLNIESHLDGAGHRDAEGLDHRQGSLDPLPNPMTAAHVRENPRRHPSEGESEIWLRPDFLNVGRGPPGFARKNVELHEQHRFAYTSKARVNEAPLIGSRFETFHKGLEALKILIPPSQRSRLSARSRGVGVVSLFTTEPF
jgi:hypothetical protein